jgi:hypothetical protein
VKASQITALAKDLARALSVLSVRVVEVIPGKSVMGLEIANEKREIVTLGEIVRSKAYDEMNSPLAIALGKDIGGQPMVADLARMPHLLIAGTTGSGKSVGINAMVLSLLYRHSPPSRRPVAVIRYRGLAGTPIHSPGSGPGRNGVGLSLRFRGSRPAATVFRGPASIGSGDASSRRHPLPRSGR